MWLKGRNGSARFVFGVFFKKVIRYSRVSCLTRSHCGLLFPFSSSTTRSLSAFSIAQCWTLRSTDRKTVWSIGGTKSSRSSTTAGKSRISHFCKWNLQLEDGIVQTPCMDFQEMKTLFWDCNLCRLSIRNKNSSEMARSEPKAMERDAAIIRDNSVPADCLEKVVHTKKKFFIKRFTYRRVCHQKLSSKCLSKLNTKATLYVVLVQGNLSQTRWR